MWQRWILKAKLRVSNVELETKRSFPVGTCRHFHSSNFEVEFPHLVPTRISCNIDILIIHNNLNFSSKSLVTNCVADFANNHPRLSDKLIESK